MEPLNLLDADNSSLERFFSALGEKKFRSSQVIQWIHKSGVVEFDRMTNLSKNLRELLAQKASITLPDIFEKSESSDGCLKWLLRLNDNNIIETVYIPEPSRGTLCISSQAGCQLNCTFCATAQQGFSRQLKTSEIIGQLWLATRQLEALSGSRRGITNIVLMGMGEPLLNLSHVLPAIRLMLDNNGYNLSRKRITLSTAGVIPGIDRLREECLTSLAVSLHAPYDDLRDKLVPLNKKYPIADLLEACKRYSKSNNDSEITFEYTMLEGINDQTKHAKKLLEVLSSVPAKINLIPFNRVEGIPFKCSPIKSIDRFREILMKGGIISTTRKTRGDDINAACGQLAGYVKPRIPKRNLSSSRVD
tara:strand:- start:831 stop:1916 length:1086 start_codon:yes stop_codon:yes gene_type:complete